MTGAVLLGVGLAITPPGLVPNDSEPSSRTEGRCSSRVARPL